MIGLPGDGARAGSCGPPPPRVIVLMGVAGSGKSTIGRRLGASLGWPYRDADEFHPQANIEKMSRGEPLNDSDRAPWLAAIAAWIDGQRMAEGAHGVVSCSALRRVYREALLGSRRDVGLVYLKGTFALIEGRMARRRGHFMPPALLRSQFETLEEPMAAEQAVVVPVHLPPKRVVERIIISYGLRPARRVVS